MRRVKQKITKKPSLRIPAVPQGCRGTVLGLDVSSATVGWCWFVDGQLVEYGKHHPAGADKHHGEKLQDYRVWLLGQLTTRRPDYVVVELPYPGPRRSAYGVLTMYYGVLLSVYYEVYGKEFPESGNMTPRMVKQVLRARKGVSYEARKRLMVLLINRLYRLSLRYKAADRGRVSDDDIADAIATAHVWFVLRYPHD